MAGGEWLNGEWREMWLETGKLHQIEPEGCELKLGFILITMESHAGSKTYVLCSPIRTQFHNRTKCIEIMTILRSPKEGSVRS